MNKNDDSDIKIFGKTKESVVPDDKDMLKIAEENAKNRKNGNTEKAKALGGRLALFAPDTDDLGNDILELIPQKYNNSKIINQVRTLIVFCAESCLNRSISSPLLLTTSINSMYEDLTQNSPMLYENLADGIAFSFYYLSLEKGKDIGTYMGVSFAMLCGMEDNETLIDIGEKLYLLLVKKISAVIDEVEFV